MALGLQQKCTTKEITLNDRLVLKDNESLNVQKIGQNSDYFSNLFLVIK
jgi:hypothetical protein